MNIHTSALGDILLLIAGIYMHKQTWKQQQS